MRGLERTFVLALLIVVCVGLFVSSASAVISCSGSGISITSNTTLTDDYVASNGTTRCLALSNGANVNMNGHSITCSGTCTIGIGALASGSSVTNSGAEAEINGFSIGVSGAQTVTGIHIRAISNGINAGGWGLNRASGNVIEGGCGAAVNVFYLPSTGQIYNNYIVQNCSTIPSVGIQVDSGDGSIHHNYITNYGLAAIRVDDSIPQPWIFKNIIGPKNPAYTDPDSRPIQDSNGNLPVGIANEENICSEASACPVPSAPWSMQ